MCRASVVLLLSSLPLAAVEPATVKVAAVQCSSDLGDTAANTKKLTRLVKEAAKNGANWSVDEKQGWWGYGFSEVISNDGKVIAAAKSLYGDDIVYADLPVAKKK